MTKDEILTLIKAGYSKADIDAMDGATTTPPQTNAEGDPSDSVKTTNGGSSQANAEGVTPSSPEPTPDPKPDSVKTANDMSFDYNEFAKAMAKAMAGMNTRNHNPSKTKEEEVNEALKGLFH